METQKFGYDKLHLCALMLMVVFEVVGLVGLSAWHCYFSQSFEHLFGTDDPTVSVNSNIMGLVKTQGAFGFR